jgi:hypothetical protein
MSTTYNTENLIAGDVKTDQARLAADTYYRGMPLAYTADSGDGYYSYSVTAANVRAIFCEPETRTLSAAGFGSIIVAGDVYEGGLVDSSGDTLAVTDDFIAALRPNGIHIKRT